ncbi:MAG: 1-acyl-sn-glycerol-3-phosphate acyltransferase [Candidatus Eremiobacteraeota bacterium]|nr:1-acyl-sn-glycerol-3-phosphate acyltransferase [Candidatus Eremiobacteraeota bacterium]
MNALYAFARSTIHVYSEVVWNAKALGTENIPLHGPLVIACNHVSLLDPPVMGSFVPRQVSYMAKKELFEIPGLGQLIWGLGAYPVDRHGSAASAIKRSVEVLRAGGCIGIFPEGGRNVEGDKEIRGGVALLASLGKAPVVPAAIVGTNLKKKRNKIKVAFGKPLALPSGRKATRDELAKFTDTVMSTIYALARDIGGNSQG